MPVGRGLIIDSDGNPMPIHNSSFSKPTARGFFHAILATPYEQRQDEFDSTQIDVRDLHYENVTKGEAIIRRLIDAATHGNYDATKLVLEYVIGKPTQSVEHQHNIQTFSDFAKHCITVDNNDIVDAETEDDGIGI